MIDSRIRAVMDFGADHGYLSIELVRCGLVTKIIATENFD